MKKYLYFFIIIISSCAKEGGIISESIIDFEILNNNSSYTTAIEFKNTSKFANGFVWYFGDGDSSTAVETNHLYKYAGTFTVTLKAFTDAGTRTINKTVTVIDDQTLVADFSFSCPKPFAYVALTTFNNLSKNATHYKWSFGDFSSDTITSPSYTFVRAGVYDISLTAYNLLGDSQTITKQITVLNEADSMIITEAIIVNTRTDLSAGIPIDMDSEPDYYLAFENWIDTSKFRTYMILNSKNFPLIYNLKSQPIRLEVPDYDPSTRYNPITIFDGDQYFERYIDKIDFNIRDWLNFSTTPYPDEITIANNYSPTTIKLKVTWK